MDGLQPDVLGILRRYCSCRTSLPGRCPDVRFTCQEADDNHGRPAVRAGEGWLDGFVRCRLTAGLFICGCHLQQLPCLFQVIPTSRIGQQAIMADTVETARQHMQQEAAHELISAERHGFVAGTAFGSVILVPERDAMFIGGDQPLV